MPIATDIAGAHLYLNAGGFREMHWHNPAEWAYILAGHCQVVVVDPEGETEIANYGPGDLWYFPKGHAHSIQTIGSEPCHAILAFDDGMYGEHGTFGLSDWMSRLEPSLLSQSLGLPNDVASKIPTAEVYVKQGEVIARDSAKARAFQVLDQKICSADTNGDMAVRPITFWERRQSGLSLSSRWQRRRRRPR